MSAPYPMTNTSPSLSPNPVDSVARVLRALGVHDASHAACLAVEAIAASCRQRSENTAADWLSAAACNRSI